MPDVDDLRAAYAMLKDQAPTEVATFANPTLTAIMVRTEPAGGPKSRQRVWLPVGVAAAVAAMVTGGVMLAYSQQPTEHATASLNAGSATGAPSAATTVSATAARSSALTYPFSADTLPDGLRAVDDKTSAQSATMDIVTSQGTLAGIITVSTEKPALPADAVAVAVGSQAGYYGHLAAAVVIPGVAVPRDAGPAGVVWQSSTGLWASVSDASVSNATGSYTTVGNATVGNATVGNAAAGGLTQAQLVALASAVQVGTPHAAMVPVKFRIPAGFQVISTGSSLSGAGGNAGGGAIIGRPGASDQQTAGSLYVGLGSGKAQPLNANTRSITIGQFSGTYSPSDTAVTLHNAAGVSIYVGTIDVSPVPLDQLTEIVQGLTVANQPNDPATWFNASQAFS